VVLGLAGDHAAVAAGADAGVDGHGPAVAVVLVLRPHREVFVLLGIGRMLFLLLERRVVLPLGEGAGADDLALAAQLDVLVLLRAGHLVVAVRLRDLRTRAAVHGVREAEAVGVDADAVADVAGLLAAVAVR